jgi:cobalt/nickel transport system permease protein
VLLACARVPLRWYVARLATLLFFLGWFLVFLPWVDHGDQRWDLGWVSLSPAGTLLALVLLLKAVAVVSLLLAAATTAPVETHLKALHALRVPGVLVQLTALTIRYLAVLLDEFNRMRIALRVRGYRQRATLRSLRVVAHVAGMLLVRGHDRAERVAQALRCRGFDGTFRALARFRTRPVDVVFFIIILGSASGLLLWDVAGR